MPIGDDAKCSQSTVFFQANKKHGKIPSHRSNEKLPGDLENTILEIMINKYCLRQPLAPTPVLNATSNC